MKKPANKKDKTKIKKTSKNTREKLKQRHKLSGENQRIQTSLYITNTERYITEFRNSNRKGDRRKLKT